jgi:hypothetical protein
MFLWLNNLPNPGGSASTVVDPEPPPEESTPVANSSQLTTFSDLYTDLQNRVRVATGVTATETQAKRYINIAIHDINLGFQYKLPWLERNAQLRTHAAYTTGTISIDVGSTTLTGSGTDWASANAYGEGNARASGKILLEGKTDIYPVSDVGSATTITLQSRYVGTENLSGATYTYYEDMYDLATDFLRPIDFQLFSTAANITLLPRDEFRRRFPRPNVAGRPEYACIVDLSPSGGTTPIRRVQLFPYPNDTYIIPYSYITSAVGVSSAGVARTSLSSDSDEPLLPLRYRHAIVFHALYHWYRDKRDDSRSQEAKAEYTDIMLRIVDDQDFGAPTKAHLRPTTAMYTRNARNPYRGGHHGRYTTGSSFDQGRS